MPFFRTDINRMCDVAEEVARMYGLAAKIPTTLYAGEMVQGEFTPSQQAERAAALVCREAGFDESMSHCVHLSEVLRHDRLGRERPAPYLHHHPQSAW